VAFFSESADFDGERKPTVPAVAPVALQSSRRVSFFGTFLSFV